MPKYKYIGEDKFFIKNGEIVEGNITTWSVKKPNSSERENVELLYVPKAGFKGEDMPINKKNLIEIVNPQTNDEDDLMQDFVSILTSFVSRLTGSK